MASSGNAVEPDIGGVAWVWRLYDIARKAEIAKRVVVEHRETVLGSDRSCVVLPEHQQAVQKGRATGRLQRRRMRGASHDGILSEAGAIADLDEVNLGRAGSEDKAEDCHLP